MRKFYPSILSVPSSLPIANDTIPVLFQKCPLLDANLFRDYVAYLFESGQMNRTSTRIAAQIRNLKKSHVEAFSPITDALIALEDAETPEITEHLKQIEELLKLKKYFSSRIQNNEKYLSDVNTRSESKNYIEQVS